MSEVSSTVYWVVHDLEKQRSPGYYTGLGATMIMKESRSAIDRGSSDPQEWWPKVEFQAVRKFTVHDGGFNRTYFGSVPKHFFKYQ